MTERKELFDELARLVDEPDKFIELYMGGINGVPIKASSDPTAYLQNLNCDFLNGHPRCPDVSDGQEALRLGLVASQRPYRRNIGRWRCPVEGLVNT